MENDLKARSRGFSTDMSPDAIAKRLDIAGDLYETTAWLRRFVPVSSVEPPAAQARSTPPSNSAGQSDRSSGVLKLA